MLAFIPIIGPASAIMLVGGWEVIKLGLILIGMPIAAATAQLISFVVWALAF